MRKAISVVTTVWMLFAAAHTGRAAESTREYSVQVSANAQTSPSPAQLTLSWPQDDFLQPRSYTIFRKSPGATSWGKASVQPGAATSYVDKNVQIGSVYEYQIVKTTSQYTGYGYIYAGINAPLKDNPGELLLVVDRTYAKELTNELARLQQDLVGDGWTVRRLDVARNDSVIEVKARIKAEYNADPANVKAVFLFGHVPVAYSGDIVPDGHAPDHQGAWPCDGFYGDMDGVWTDERVNNTSAADARNRNVVGDGKFDQSTFPAPLKLMVGRVDLANMPGRLTYGGAPTFPNELDLLRNYLNKDHAFRTKQFDLPRRGLVGDYFGIRDGEAFAASGWRNLAPFFASENVTTLPTEGTWIPMLHTNSYLWAYGCGPGSFTSIGGLGNSDAYHDGVTTEFYKNDIKAVFTMLFGSWLGDWDSEDNLQRAVLALPTYGLTCALSGRPHWFLQHMALGEPIGFSTRLTQNNRRDGLYQNEANNCASQIHIALMGDPTLRMHAVSPPTGLNVLNQGKEVTLNWEPSSDSIVGYHVYRATNPNGPFTRLTSSPIEVTRYIDADARSVQGATYMVRAVKLETSGSGTYYNASQGAFPAPVPMSVDSVVAANQEPAIVNPSTPTGREHKSKEAPAILPTSTGASTNAVRPLTPTGDSIVTTNSTVWVEDGLPTGAVGGSDGGDFWNWVTSSPTPYSGSAASQSTISAGLHQHFFSWATATLSVNMGETLYAYVYLDPANLPSEIMLQWNDGSWEHRAYWGGNKIDYGVNGTVARRYMGPLPAAGQWARLEVPASQVGLEGSTLNGMAFSTYDGRATFDAAGKAAVIITTTPGTNSNGTVLTNSVAWVDDSVPAGGIAGFDGGDNWTWVNNSPASFSGNLANQSAAAAGQHQHFFYSATSTLTVNPGDSLFAYVYLDPANVPTELMLQWNDGSWDHRAYWGADRIDYGITGTSSRRYIGPMPAADQWVRLEVPASLVNLEGSTLNGMAFSLFNGRATWDLAGKSSLSVTNITPTPKNNPPVVTNTPPSTNNPPAAVTNALAGSSLIDYIGLTLPNVGDNSLHLLAPNLLELKLINTKARDPARVAEWDFVDASYNLNAPGASSFNVLVNGQTVAVTAVGFKRRPLYASLAGYDLRIENSLYLQLASPLSDNQTVEVKNPGGNLWAPGKQFIAKAEPLRYSPAIHVNQEGYMPNYSKKAMVGYYLGSLGEMNVPASSGFKLVDANTGAPVFQGSLVQRLDTGWQYVPPPYQKVYEADFTSFNTPGQYRLVVPGLGGSLPFSIHNGVAMDFARSYALGLYHQRCGTNTAMPYTRFTHDTCHAAPATVPDATSLFTWTTIAGYANTLNDNNPPQIAPLLTSPLTQLFPFGRTGSVDVSGGHHDAGDYSKYTINSASFIHYLMFAADSLNGVAALDNLGIPESGDGISDIMQEAKWEADFLCKLQDTDGGFYFLVYPANREYEGNVTPDHGDAQVVWPKTTSVTAASVAALAQCASSPLFKRTFPQAAALYLQKAQLGWQFLVNAVNRYGKNGAYQKITHYGDDFADNDELAWAACQMYLATSDQTIHQKLKSWFDPADPATWRWGWWHMSQCFGHAIRSYAFAIQRGRMTAGQLDATFLAKCQAEVIKGGDDVVTWAQQSSYGTSFPENTKRVKGAGWYFSTDQAFDIAVAYQLNAKPEYMNAMLSNMNYEGGCNPINLCYVTGLGYKRQRDIVSQWALNDTRILPPSGIPVGNIQNTFGYLWNYQGALQGLTFPPDGLDVAPYPFYDRWGDSWNVSAEFVILNSARSLGTLGFLAAQTSLKTQAWRAVNSSLTVPTSTVPSGSSVTISMNVPGMDLSTARITWEARDEEPTFGPTFTYAPKNNGTQWVEGEAQWPDGRRAFATATFNVNSPNVVWVDDSLPTGASAGSDGGDSWTWVTSNPAPNSGAAAHQSALARGSHQHFFNGATATLAVGTGDVLYAWVYLDPANPPVELMLQWDTGSPSSPDWNHRAYWGTNVLSYGTDGNASRRYVGPLPATGRWVQLQVPASQVGLEGKTVSGMAFTLFDGRATWDAAGRQSASSRTTVPVPASLRVTPTGATLTWPSVANSVYRVSYKNNLGDPTWTLATANGITATGTTSTWTDTTSKQASQRFYIVQADQ